MIHKKGRPVRDGRRWLAAPRLHQQPNRSRHNEDVVRPWPFGCRNDERTPVVEPCRYEQLVRALAPSAGLAPLDDHSRRR